MTTQEQIEAGLEALRALSALRINPIILTRRQLNKLSDREFNNFCRDMLSDNIEALEMLQGKEMKEYILAKDCLRQAKLEATRYMQEVYKKSLTILLEKAYIRYDLQEMKELYPQLFSGE